MKQGFDDVPIVCCLTSAELREREATILAHFRSAVIETEELPNGFAFCVRGDRKSVALTAEMIAAEKECCPFLTFEFVAEPSMGPVIVRVTRPPGTKDFLRTVSCKPDASI